jgi:Spy/CpxP family protein refolding chaperone
MTVGKTWQVGELAGAMALGMAFTTASTAKAQDNGQQQNNAGQGRRNRGQGGGAGGAFARNPSQAVETMQKQVNELKLSDDQKTKLDAIFKEAETQAKTVASESESLQGRERMQKVMGFSRDLREKVNGVLTEEQRQTLRKNQATAMAKQMVEGQRRRLGELDLSADQKTKVDAVLADAEKKMADAAAQAQPADGQGQGGGRGGPMMEVMRDTREKINQILTPEQQQKFQASGGGRGQGGGRRGGQGGAGNGN